MIDFTYQKLCPKLRTISITVKYLREKKLIVLTLLNSRLSFLIKNKLLCTSN